MFLFLILLYIFAFGIAGIALLLACFAGDIFEPKERVKLIGVALLVLLPFIVSFFSTPWPWLFIFMLRGHWTGIGLVFIELIGAAFVFIFAEAIPRFAGAIPSGLLTIVRYVFRGWLYYLTLPYFVAIESRREIKEQRSRGKMLARFRREPPYFLISSPP
jgi:hypothetical protein